MLTGSLSCKAEPFGKLYYEVGRPSLGTLDTNFAKWLMTLPADETSAVEDNGQMLAADPIGGEVYRLMAAQQLEGSANRAGVSLTAQAFDPDPIGRDVYHLTVLSQPDGLPEPKRLQAALTARSLDANPIGGEVYHLTKPVDRDPTASALRTESGLAVWYRLPGRTASGEIADPNALTAGHRTLPLGTRVRVVNRMNGASVVVRINDRGPKQRKFVIDLSQASAKAIGLTGTAPVTLNVEQPAAVAANVRARSPALEGRSAARHPAAIITKCKSDCYRIREHKPVIALGPRANARPRISAQTARATSPPRY
ncbi:MAG: hypothetical protein NVSMB26_27490 [Beijerinckiaceae bacterium]